MTALAAPPLIRRLRLSATLSGYLARQYGLWFCGFLFGLMGVVLLVSSVDLLDRLATRDSPMSVVVRMALLRLPFLSLEVMPFTILFAGLACFWKLSRSHELVVTRAAGISVWQLLTPILGLAVLIGLLTVALLNPIAATLLTRYEHLEAKHIHNRASPLTVSKTGLWLRQADEEGQSVIHAERVRHDTMTLSGVTVFRFAGEDRFTGRIDARRAELGPGHWRLYDARRFVPGEPQAQQARIDLPTDLTREKILESFAPPETISFWSLPDFIELLEAAGFSAVRHKLQLHKLLATPVLFAAMILFAAIFSLRSPRRGRVGLIILGGVLTGFLLYFVSSFVFALGLTGKLPVVLAAWTPAGVSLMLGTAMLLHLEDG